MAEDERRGRMCVGKTRYKDQAAAELAVQHIEWDHGTTGLRTYRCEYCGRWHLTSKAPRQ